MKGSDTSTSATAASISYEDYKTLEMQPTRNSHEYAAVVPGGHVPSRFDFMYFIEAMDNVGNGRLHPDLYREQPYFVVPLQREDASTAGRGAP